jgi:type IV pilus assembly protein PilC
MAIEINKITASKKQKKGVSAAAVSSTTDKVSWLNKDISFGAAFSNTKKHLFYEELSVLLGAGMDIQSSFELIEEEQLKEKDRVIIHSIKESIITGKSLSEALKAAGHFSPYEYYSIQIGEETGKTVQVLADLSLYFQRLLKQRRQLVSALTYPGIVMCTAGGSIFFMLNYMVPMFSEIFLRFKGDLPAITKAIIHLSNLMKLYFFPSFLLMSGIGIFFYLNKQTIWYRKYHAKVLLKIPIIGPIFHKIYLARFCNSLYLLMASKVSMVRAISLVKQMIDFYPIEKAMEEIESKLINGATLHSCLAMYPIFDKKMVYLIKVGEEVNKVDRFLDQLNKQYSDEVEYKSSMIGSLIEPVMIVFLGLVVGVVLIAMYLPLFQLGNSF